MMKALLHVTSRQGTRCLGPDAAGAAPQVALAAQQQVRLAAGLRGRGVAVAGEQQSAVAGPGRSPGLLLLVLTVEEPLAQAADGLGVAARRRHLQPHRRLLLLSDKVNVNSNSCPQFIINRFSASQIFIYLVNFD